MKVVTHIFFSDVIKYTFITIWKPSHCFLNDTYIIKLTVAMSLLKASLKYWGTCVIIMEKIQFRQKLPSIIAQTGSDRKILVHGIALAYGEYRTMIYMYISISKVHCKHVSLNVLRSSLNNSFAKKNPFKLTYDHPWQVCVCWGRGSSLPLALFMRRGGQTKCVRE